jgi:multiple sugar transport system permease protein
MAAHAQAVGKPRKASRFRILPKGRIERKEALWFWFFIAPWVFGFIVFTAGPIIASAYLSLTKYAPGKPPEFIGFANYLTLYNDRIFWKSLGVTTYYVALAVPLGIIASLLLAVLLNQKIPFMGVFRTLYYLPSLLAGSVSIVLLFSWLLNPQFGIINYIIRSLVGAQGLIPLGIVGPRWLQDPNWVVPSYTMLALWGFGGGMLVYLSALQGVPTHLYEAATIDGATRFQQFFKITIPMISPVILFTMITGIIAAFQVFAEAYVLAGQAGSGQQTLGAPAYSSMFYVLYLFANGFQRYRFGLAAAQAWILFLVILGLTLLMFRVSRRFVYYESEEEGMI